jgi:hypothetical protein
MSPDAESVFSSSSSSSDESGAPPPPPSSVGSSGGALRVSYTSRKSRHCTLCNAKSTDESPLEYTEEIFQKCREESRGDLTRRSKWMTESRFVCPLESFA